MRWAATIGASVFGSIGHGIATLLHRHGFMPATLLISALLAVSRLPGSIFPPRQTT